MNMRRYDKNSDYEMMTSWYTKRDLPPIPKESIPVIGYIAEEKAAAFLCVTDSSFCFIEFLIASPETTKEERKQYVHELNLKLFKDAKALGFNKIINYMENTSVINSLKEIGFEEKCQDKKIVCLVKEL